MTGLTVTVDHLRELLEEGGVLVVDPIDGPSVHIAANLGDVAENAIVVADYELEEDFADGWDEQDLAEALPAVQEKAGTVAADLAKPAHHFTAWVTTDRSCLESDYADVQVFADDITQDLGHNSHGSHAWKIEFEMTGDPLMTAVTDVDVTDPDETKDATEAAEDLLEAAGWRVTGTWEAVGTGYIAEVEPDEELWNVDRVAQEMGIAPRSAANAMRRQGVTPLHREVATGKNVYSKTAVLYGLATRPGAGARTDLEPEEN